MIDFWTAALALTTLLYVTLDGFDLGVGMLLPFLKDERQRRGMLAAISPVWDGNETWLILTGTILFGAFPLAYATLLSAFYLPLLVMLCALIFRGVAFEFRGKAVRTRALWDWGFIVGSYVATFVQGVAVGALVRGLPMSGTSYVGGPFGWFSPFALLCGVGLCLGYALLGAGWLAYKSQPEVQALGFRLLPFLLTGVLVFLVAAFVFALRLDLQVMHRWVERPVLLVFPLVGLVACAVTLLAVRRRWELVPFLCGLAIFTAALGTLGVSFFPYMVPFAITTFQAASPPSSLEFMFWGCGVVVLPLTLLYTLVIYFVFKGKVALDQAY